MLTETQTLGVGADFNEELEYPGNKVPQGLVGDNAFVNSVSDFHDFRLAATSLLSVSIEKDNLNVAYFVKFLMILVFRIDIMLNFSHRKLPDTKKACTRRNLIAEGAADLS
jgi:hypothetical protein